MKTIILTIATAILIANFSQADDISFDTSNFTKKSFEWQGYVELHADNAKLNQESSFYKLNNYAEKPDNKLRTQTGIINLNGKYINDAFTFNLSGNFNSTHDQLKSSDSGKFDTAYFLIKPTPAFTLDIGKQSLKWGKGYAWNLVGFAERVKDISDPDSAREGFNMLSADYITNFDVALKTLALTTVILPVDKNINNDYGKSPRINPIAKLYLLFYDTDIDILWQGSGSRTSRWGIDFSRNITNNIEIHGEWARINAQEKVMITPEGKISKTLHNINNYLLGIRYLSEQDTTWIAEYYHNGAGYSKEELANYHDIVANSNSLAQLTILRTISQNYSRPNVGKNNFYLRVSQKEPFNILYLTPSFTIIKNIDDNSYSFNTEMLYTGFTNLEMRFRMSWLKGKQNSEFGEKPNRNKIEAMVKYYF